MRHLSTLPPNDGDGGRGEGLGGIRGGRRGDSVQGLKQRKRRTEEEEDRGGGKTAASVIRAQHATYSVLIGYTGGEGGVERCAHDRLQTSKRIALAA